MIIRTGKWISLTHEEKQDLIKEKIKKQQA